MRSPRQMFSWYYLAGASAASALLLWVLFSSILPFSDKLATLPPLTRSATDLSYFFVFGDSYSTTDFNFFLAQPSVKNPLGNPQIGHGTSSGGLNWVGYLTTQMNSSLILTYDFATPNAFVNNSLIGVGNAPMMDLTNQVKLGFENIYVNSTPWRSHNSLFAFWVGINDIGNTWLREDPYNDSFTIISHYFEAVEDIYRDGGRHFLFLSVPPTTRSPMIIDLLGAPELITSYIKIYNGQLSRSIEEFKGNHSDVTVIEYDTYSLMSQILDRPTYYGFRDNTCVGSDGCFWHDGYHPSVEFHRLLAEDLAPKLQALGTGWR